VAVIQGAPDRSDRHDLRRRLRKLGLVATSDKSAAAHLRVFGLNPDVIFDVGVDRGTPQLYQAFPEAEFVLVDPRPECRVALAGLARASFHEVALGSVPGRLTLSTPLTGKGLEANRASLNRPMGPMARGIKGFETRTVEVMTLDALAATYPGSVGLKLDTEGHEAEILAGATETLKRCQFVIVELSLTQRFDTTPPPSRIIAMLAAAGLEFRDVLRSTGDGAGGPAPRLMDALFTRWSAPILRGEGD
jgi:FkbM family methyltransferase